jgi:catechol 2,3-dioxygenase-like lactoylglutathione lyase family enzyme
MLSPKTSVLRISHVQLRVRDLGRSIAFYRELLGMHESPQRALNGKACECVARDPHYEEFGVALAQGLPDDVGVGPPGHVFFEVATVEEAAELYRKAREMGAQAIKPHLSGGRWRTLIFDPDGHKLEVTAKETQASQGAAC